MQYEIKTHKGINFKVDGVGLDLEAYKDSLNNRQLATIALLDIVMNKNNIKIMAPKETPIGDNIKVLTTNDGESYHIQLDDYDAEAISAMLNDAQNEFVLIGNVIVNRYSFDLLKPL